MTRFRSYLFTLLRLVEPVQCHANTSDIPHLAQVLLWYNSVVRQLYYTTAAFPRTPLSSIIYRVISHIWRQQL